jgi:hypothetical protein
MPAGNRTPVVEPVAIKRDTDTKNEELENTFREEVVA